MKVVNAAEGPPVRVELAVFDEEMMLPLMSTQAMPAYTEGLAPVVMERAWIVKLYGVFCIGNVGTYMYHKVGFVALVPLACHTKDPCHAEADAVTKNGTAPKKPGAGVPCASGVTSPPVA